MSTLFTILSTRINAAPQVCVLNEFLLAMEGKNLNSSILYNRSITEGPRHTEIAQLKHKDPEAILHTAARFLLTLVVLPIIAHIGVWYNLSVGVIKIGLGVVSHFKGVEEEAVKQQISVGLQHLIIATYNFALSFTIVAGTVAVAYALFPKSAGFSISVEQFHSWLYKGVYGPQAAPSNPEIHHPVSLQTAPNGNGPPLIQESQIKLIADRLVKGSFEKIQQAPESSSVNPSGEPAAN